MINKGFIKRVGNQTVDVQLAGSAATLPGVALSGQIDRSTLAVGMPVLVDTVDGRPVVLHTVTEGQRGAVLGGSVGASTSGTAVTNNALLADGSVPLTGNLAATPGVTIDGYDISVLGQTIDNLQAADSVARTGHTVLTHASHFVSSVGADDTGILIRHGIFIDKETLVVSNTSGEVEFMRVVGDPVVTVDDRGALCYRYSVTRRTATNPPGIVTGWAAATLVNGLTHRGYISIDARENSVASPNLRFILHTDIDAGSTEQIVRLGNVRGILGNGDDDYGFAVGRLTTGDRYFSYNYNRNLLALRGADIAVSDDTGAEVFRVWAVAEDGHDAGNTRLGMASGGHIETKENRVDFYNGSQRVMTISPTGTRFRGMIWSGEQPGPQVGIGEDDGQGLIAARNVAGVGQFVVRTGVEHVHVHIGNPIELGGYSQFANGEWTTDGIVRARAFELLGGGSIGSGVVLTNAGKFTAGAGNNVAVIDGEDATWRMYTGNAVPASAPFRVSQAGEAWLTNAHVTGEVTASTGSIGGWTINSTYLAKDTGINSTSAGLAPSDYPFYAGSTYANRATAPFRVTPAGVLTATSGTVGGWTLGASSLVGSNATLHNSGYLNLGTGNDIARLDAADATYRLWIGNSSAAAAPFRVTKAGVLTASNATITGTIHASAGDITGSLYVGQFNPRIHIDGTNKRIESTNFASGTSGFRIEATDGSAEFNNVTVRGALTASVIQYGYVLATNGSIWVVKAAGKTIATFVAPKGGTSPLDIEDPDGMTHAAAGGLWTVGDIVRLQEPLVGDFWGTVTAKADMTTYWRLTVQDQSLAGGDTFTAGASALNYGQSGDGVVRITADASNSPYVSIATHTGTPWVSLTERARLGKLTGISGATGYGLWTDNGYFTGTVNASAGAIGGWTIASGHLYAGSGSNRAGLQPASYPFYAGSETPASAPFRVTPAGALTASGAAISGTLTSSAGVIAGWTLAPTKLYWEDVPNLRGIGMANYDDASGYAFWAGSSTIANAEFRVTKSGALTATTANVTGTVTASAGDIAGWTLASGHMYSGSGSARAGLQPATYPFYAGSETPSAAPFRVTPAGALTASSATISGTITSTAGTIGGWTLASTALTSGSGATTVGLDSGGTNPVIYAGSATPGSAPFRVTNAGALTATNVSITAGSGSVVVDTSGLTMTYGNTAARKIQWKESGTVRGAIGCWYGLANYAIFLDAPEIDLNGTLVADKITMTGDLEHSSLGKVGFFGVTPAARPAAYTFTNGTADRTINCDSTTAAKLADVVYTMWNDLKSLGLLQ